MACFIIHMHVKGKYERVKVCKPQTMKVYMGVKVNIRFHFNPWHYMDAHNQSLPLLA